MTAVQMRPIGQILLGRGLVRSEQIDAALLEQHRSGHQRLLGEILVEQQHCTEEQVAEALAEACEVPFARVSPRLADPAVVCTLPLEFAQRNGALPLFCIEDVLTVALSEPANLFLPEEISRLTGLRVQVVGATLDDIQATLDAYLQTEKMFVVDELVEDVNATDFSIALPASHSANSDAPPAGAMDPPVVKLVNSCLFQAVEESATDVHIEPGEDSLRIRHRIDGRLVVRMTPPARMSESVAARIRYLAGIEPSAKRLPQKGTIRLSMRGREMALRVSTVPGHFGDTIVLHLGEEDRGVLKLEKLGFGYDTLKQWKRLTSLPSGMILVSGPSGSGKRDTLYATLGERSEQQLNICTVEDPVERTLNGVNQFQVDEQAGFTFASAVRSLLHQEPDVLMVSWIRDVETARLAAQAVMSGRLVLGALHAPDAPSTIARLNYLGVEPYVIGATISGVLAMRQVRRLCPSCRESYEPSATERRQVEGLIGSIGSLYRPRGCDRCHQIGYLGRIALHELLICDDAMGDRISQGATLAQLREASISTGYKSLRIDGLEKVKSGLTTLDEVSRAII